MKTSAEWQITETGGLQVVLDPERAGKSFLTLGVDDLEEHVATLARRELSVGPITTVTMSTGEVVRIASVTDPEGTRSPFSEAPATRPVPHPR